MVQNCERCGGQLEIQTAKKIAVCPYCDTVFSLSENTENTRRDSGVFALVFGEYVPVSPGAIDDRPYIQGMWIFA